MGLLVHVEISWAMNGDGRDGRSKVVNVLHIWLTPADLSSQYSLVPAFSEYLAVPLTSCCLALFELTDVGFFPGSGTGIWGSCFYLQPHRCAYSRTRGRNHWRKSWMCCFWMMRGTPCLTPPQASSSRPRMVLEECGKLGGHGAV